MGFRSQRDSRNETAKHEEWEQSTRSRHKVNKQLSGQSDRRRNNGVRGKDHNIVIQATTQPLPYQRWNWSASNELETCEGTTTHVGCAIHMGCQGLEETMGHSRTRKRRGKNAHGPRARQARARIQGTSYRTTLGDPTRSMHRLQLAAAPV